MLRRLPAEEAGAGEVLKADEVVPLESAQVKHSAADFDAEEIPMATSIFKGMDYARQKGPPESLRVRPPPLSRSAMSSGS